MEFQQQELEQGSQFRVSSAMKMIVCSLVGIFSFFVSFEWQNKNTILIDHIVNFIRAEAPLFVTAYVLIMLVGGAIHPFITSKWNKSTVNIVMSIFKVGGMVAGILLIFNIAPAWLADESIGPYLLEKLVKPVGVLIPIGSLFLALLVSYGLLEYIGVLAQPFMKPVFKTSGRSAVDAVASFVGSYSVGLLLTNRVYMEGRYTAKEAAIIATGFSTVSATFMVVVASTLDMMEHWNAFFWVSLVVTFVVTALTARMYPLRSMKDEYYEGATPMPEKIVRKGRFKEAWRQAMEAVEQNPPLSKILWTNLKDGFIMAMGVIPSILSIGLLGLVLATYTPIFDWLAYIFVPFTYVLQVPEPFLTAKALSLSLAEVFLPALVVTQATLVTKFIVAVVSISAILFFSAVIPLILSSEIPLTLRQIIIIWFERVVLTLIIVTPIAFLLF
ncbi:YjiH family protein [Lysinibacillus sphaericus]|uniref:YjiH family protein n=1 Tax=Lysinibacillus sphaericus TaxID=1421 RepID=UPI001CBE28FF|nr:YjiH family protein [Lysinibacillus sphaericus]